MLILVGVTVNVALNGGLFGTAKKATQDTQIAAEKEQLLSAVVAAMGNNAEVDFATLDSNLPTGWTGTNGTYTSPKGNKYTVKADGTIEYTGNGGGQTPGGDDNPPSDVPSTYKESIGTLPDGVEVVKYADLETETNSSIKTAVDAEKIQTVLKEGEYIAPIPTGFEVSAEESERTISGGLVIKEGSNEYVFIPCADETYTEDSFGPLEDNYSKYDSQEQLDYYYGENYYNYAEDFNYAQDKANIETSIRNYKGFYVGRYETTINNGTIGSQKGATVLTAVTTLKEGKNSNTITPYYYRWYGLYKAQKDLYANNSNVFSSMITSKEWDTIMTFTGYGSTKRASNTYTTKPNLSGSAYKGTTDTYDLSKNIYDLAGNVGEWTLKADDTLYRVFRGGYYSSGSFSASSTHSGYTPSSIRTEHGSRLALYIK